MEMPKPKKKEKIIEEEEIKRKTTTNKKKVSLWEKIFNIFYDHEVL